MNDPQMFLVGGAVRDRLLGLNPKDLDFAVEMLDHTSTDTAFPAMREFLTAEHGVKFFDGAAKPEFVTERGQFPKTHPLFPGAACDFVLCRKDGASTDGRRPDSVSVGDIFDDLARRDFTVNAVAQEVLPDSLGQFVDPHRGIGDLAERALVFVGSPMRRINEDGLRVLRGFRFMVTKRLHGKPTFDALISPEAAAMLGCVAEERREAELRQMFEHDHIATMRLLTQLPDHTNDAIFAGRVRITSTLKDI